MDKTVFQKEAESLVAKAEKIKELVSELLEIHYSWRSEVLHITPPLVGGLGEIEVNRLLASSAKLEKYLDLFFIPQLRREAMVRLEEFEAYEKRAAEAKAAAEGVEADACQHRTPSDG